MIKKKEIVIVVSILIGCNSILGQTNTRDSINNLLKEAPQFTIFKDNYFITGFQVNEPINSNNSDAKFQISIKDRLTNAVLPFNSFLYFTYTQKSFWNIYKNSSPFSENNYNPGMGLGKFYLNKHRLLNMVGIGLDHESNGKDSIDSRSWNKVSFHYRIAFPGSITLAISTWIPFAYKSDNPDLIKYIGYFEANLIKKSRDNRFVVEITAKKGATWDNRGSFQTQFYYRIGKNNNQYLSLQYYTGYAESLLHYSESTNSIRIGLVFRPSNFFLHE